MNLTQKRYLVAILAGFFALSLLVVAYVEATHKSQETKLTAVVTSENKSCVNCHTQANPALVQQWEQSRHAQQGIGCIDCHRANKTDVDAWEHNGNIIATIVTPKDCAQCHVKENDEFARSHHARAGEILASLDNILAEKIAGTPHNNSDAVNGCLQCHGSIVKLSRDAKGQVIRDNGRPIIDPNTWPNSGIGRLNLDGSKGSCNACHSRHTFEAKLARQPDNCGKCHMGPDHPQIEIYKESKHGIAFEANKDKMNLGKQGNWVLGQDYSAAPTCTTCHTGSFQDQSGEVVGNNHDVGDRISWTLRPVVSTKLNQVIYQDGYKEDYPEGKPLPKVGEKVVTQEKMVKDEVLTTQNVPRVVARVKTWDERRDDMKAVCRSCHNNSFIDNFYTQFDGLVVLYNEKFAKPGQALMNELTADGVLNPKKPFEYDVQWIFYELWHHEGRRARHGASMQGPDYTHWHGMYEVSKNFYTKFLPAVVEAAGKKGPALKAKYQAKVAALLEKDEHIWTKGMTPAEVENLRKTYKARYNQ